MRSPTTYSSTVGPTATTVPMYSWPGVKFLLNGRPPSINAGAPCPITSRSVAQIATASTRTSTSAGPGFGTGLSIRASWPGSRRTQALMVSGTGIGTPTPILAAGWLVGGGLFRRLIDLFGREQHDCFRLNRAAGIDRHRRRRDRRVVGRVDEHDGVVLAKREVESFHSAPHALDGGFGSLLPFRASVLHEALDAIRCVRGG